MRATYYPSSELEKFGVRVYNMLVENFSQTFFVGGMVRDILLRRKIIDVDIATEATPDTVIKILKQHNIAYEDSFKKFGVIVAVQKRLRVEIATLRIDLPSSSRYNKVEFVRDAKMDSYRRDFTINALYFRMNSGEIADYHSGLQDLKKQVIRTIGKPEIRFTEDPLRIIRAWRFALQLQFKIESQTSQTITTHAATLLKKITKQKMQSEILKMKEKNLQKELQKLINRYVLDNR